MDADRAFLFKLILSFIVGGGWVALATATAQRLGSKAGGVIAGMPSTALVALLFVGLTQGETAASEATTVIPACLAATCALMVGYASAVRFGLIAALAAGCGAWLFSQFLIVTLGPPGIVASCAAAGFSLLLSVFIFERIFSVHSVAGQSAAVSRGVLLFRAVAAGVIIVATVLLARYSGPLLSGIFSVIPVVMVSTLVITYRKVGPEFSRAIAKTHMVSGVVTCTVYVLGVRYLYPALGVWLGTLGAYAVTLPFSFAIYQYVMRWMR